MNAIRSEQALTQIQAALSRYYTEPGRHYHGMRHIQKMLFGYATLYDDEIPPAIRLAIYAHDAIYVWGAKDNMNERMSVQVLRNLSRPWIEKDLLDPDIVELAVHIVGRTTIDIHVEVPFGRHRKEVNRFLDLDLLTLGEPDYDTFVEHQNDVLREACSYDGPIDDLGCFWGYSDLQMRELRDAQAEFLEKFKQRLFIYRTREARDAYEALAQQNITRFIAEHRNRELQNG